MKLKLLRAFIGLGMALLAFAAGPADAGSPARQLSSCEGKFPDPMEDLCWSCFYPISIAGSETGDGQDIPGDNGSPECVCPAPPPLFERVGATGGFWEPVRSVDITRKPFCLVGLGGIEVSSDGGGGGSETAEAGGALDMPEHTQNRRSSGATDGSFYQAHWYESPVAYILELVADVGCISSGSMELKWLTEVDPLWNDDETTNILNFESALFSNIIVQLTCAIDCVAASIPLPFAIPIPAMFWCAGCNGPTFPMDGFVPAHIGGIQAASLIAQRLAHKMQRQSTEWMHHTYAAVCMAFPTGLIDKLAFKQQIVYPVPQTSKVPYCCNWMGATNILSGSLKEYPYKGEDFSFFMFRKRVCCIL